MATNKIHFLSALMEGFPAEDAAVIIINDSIRCWVPDRALGHFTINPDTNEVSWMTFPSIPVKEWNEDVLKNILSYSAGKPGTACVDEDTVLTEFWKHNNPVTQNHHIYMHLVQDELYDRFVRNFIDVSRRYEDVFVFQDKEYSGDDLRGKGMARWNDDGLLNQLDAQFYVRLAKLYYERTSILANRQWIEEIMKPAIFRAYHPDLAEKTVKFISINDLAEEIISSKDFDRECWPLPNSAVDEWVNAMQDKILYLIGY